MKITKKAAILSATYIAAGFLILGGFIYKESLNTAGYRRQVALNYNHAFSELATAVGEMDTALKRVAYASSPSLISSVCAEAYAKAVSAEAALGVLPYGNIKLEHTAAFISKTGDYIYFLSKNAASGNGFSEDDRKNISELSKSATTVSNTLSDLSAQLLAGSVSVSELEEAESAISSAEDSMVNTGLAGSFKQMESEFPEMPTLIYDGPFSEHIKKATPKLLEGADEVSEEQAINAAVEFLNSGSKGFNLEHSRESDIPVYVITRKSSDETMTFEITKLGGQVVYFGSTHENGAAVLSAEDGVKAAEKFLSDKGYKSLRKTYWVQENGDVTVNFAYEQDGVICYPDLIKVTVSLDTGSIKAFESLGYIMSHTERTIPEASVSQEQAQSVISADLTVKSYNKAIIPTSGKNEVFCHEFLCEDAEGKHCLIYVNAETGNEEKILMLLEGENGTLTI